MDEIAGRCVNFDAVETRSHRALRRRAKLSRDPGYFVSFQNARNDEILLAVVRLVLPLDGDGGRRHRQRAARQKVWQRHAPV